MALRIAVAGPEATGKTTLARGLAVALGVTIVDDVRRDVLARSRCHTLFEVARLRPVWHELLETQLGREESETGSVVIDTCALDYWALFVRWGWCDATPSTAEELRDRMIVVASRYTHIFLMPEHQLPEFRGHRFLDRDHARQTRRVIEGFLAGTGLATKVHRFSPGTRDDYLRESLSLVDGSA